MIFGVSGGGSVALLSCGDGGGSAGFSDGVYGDLLRSWLLPFAADGYPVKRLNYQTSGARTFLVLSGDARSYLSGKTLTVGGATYDADDPNYGPFYNDIDDETTIRWDNGLVLVAGTAYPVEFG